eukprot:TRINITY_DN1923_c0_g1_i2.p1 TRINITY_DN1923_c0_g1~~TRINITY_DN1923_c0_g1_i2.p1  ORF type:complete len:427 (-),score=62.05 TRINITY_DN1923_c0_g1_i2:38-1318(-)
MNFFVTGVPDSDSFVTFSSGGSFGMNGQREKLGSNDNAIQTKLILKHKVSRTWDPEEDHILIRAYKEFQGRNWKKIAQLLPGRTASQCSQRWRRLQSRKIRRPWTDEEDEKVIEFVNKYGRNWSLISQQLYNRSGKQIRERFLNKLNPKINRMKWTEEEDELILKLYYEIGPLWSKIAKHLIGRPENMVKNRFYAHLRKSVLPIQEVLKMEDKENTEVVNENHEISSHEVPVESNQSPAVVKELEQTEENNLNSYLERKAPIDIEFFLNLDGKEPLEEVKLNEKKTSLDKLDGKEGSDTISSIQNLYLFEDASSTFLIDLFDVDLEQMNESIEEVCTEKESSEEYEKSEQYLIGKLSADFRINEENIRQFFLLLDSRVSSEKIHGGIIKGSCPQKRSFRYLALKERNLRKVLERFCSYMYQKRSVD